MMDDVTSPDSRRETPGTGGTEGIEHVDRVADAADVVSIGPYTREGGLAFAGEILFRHHVASSGNTGESFWRRVGQTLRWGRRKEDPDRYRYGGRLIPQVPTKRDIGVMFGFSPTQLRRESSEEIILHFSLIPTPKSEETDAMPSKSFGTVAREIPVRCVVILRTQGAMFYEAILAEARGESKASFLRPVLLEPSSRDEMVYAVMAPLPPAASGHRFEGRVGNVRVRRIPDCASWYGTAHAADSLTGVGLLTGTEADLGDRWTVCRGAIECTHKGARLIRDPQSLQLVTETVYDELMRRSNVHRTSPTSLSRDGLAILDTEVPTGLLHAVVDIPGRASLSGLVWRARDEQNFWCFLVDAGRCYVFIVEEGLWLLYVDSDVVHLHPSASHSMQVLDDGDVFRVRLDGTYVFQCSDTRLSTETGVGFYMGIPNTDLFVRSFEAHPRHIVWPDSLGPVLSDDVDLRGLMRPGAPHSIDLTVSGGCRGQPLMN